MQTQISWYVLESLLQNAGNQGTLWLTGQQHANGLAIPASKILKDAAHRHGEAEQGMLLCIKFVSREMHI